MSLEPRSLSAPFFPTPHKTVLKGATHFLRHIPTGDERSYLARYTRTKPGGEPVASYFQVCAENIDLALCQAMCRLTGKFTRVQVEPYDWKNGDELVQDLSVHLDTCTDFVELAEELLAKLLETDPAPIQKMFYFPNGISMLDLVGQRETLSRLYGTIPESDQEGVLAIESALRVFEAMIQDWVYAVGEREPDSVD